MLDRIRIRIGISTEGTSFEPLAATGHPAVRAVAPLLSDYNFSTDLIRPGGVYLEWLIKNRGWSRAREYFR